MPTASMSPHKGPQPQRAWCHHSSGTGLVLRPVSTAVRAQMGLGKTAQSVATMACIQRAMGPVLPFLVIAPLTTLGHWVREIETWTDMVRPSGSGARGVKRTAVAQHAAAPSSHQQQLLQRA